MDHRLADVGYQCWRTILPEETLAMKLGFVIPIVGPAVSGAPCLSAFCRGLEDLGYDTLWVGDRLVTPVDVDSSYLAHRPQMTRSLDPVLLWTVAAAATSRMRLNASTLSTFSYRWTGRARSAIASTSTSAFRMTRHPGGSRPHWQLGADLCPRPVPPLSGCLPTWRGTKPA
jgi:hypothetical protein